MSLAMKMSKENKGSNSFSRLTRREFFEKVALGAFAAWGLASVPPSLLAEEPEASRVVVARSERLLTDEGVDIGEARRILDEGVSRLLGKDAPSAWRSLFRPDDVVALKVNCLGKPTDVQLTLALADAIESAGVPAHRIIVWDRSDRELRSAGFRLNARGSGLQVRGTDNPASRGYSPFIQSAGSVGSLFSRILLNEATAIVSLPVLKDHDIAGVTLGMKNFFGAIHNPNKYHSNNCDPYIAELMTHPAIRGKLRLVVCDASMPQAHGGPAFDPRWDWPFGGVILGTDPVAVDAVGMRIIEKRRRKLGLNSLEEEGRPPKYIKTAQKLGLGNAGESKIEVEEI